jgi:tRNA threonylcarbamoyl adenosine modification protein (Sua5/YciO/YrdC/YwlC family)
MLEDRTVSQVLSATNASSAAQVKTAVAAAVAAVKNGGLAVIPTDTSYAVICDAFNTAAITKLRMAKKQVSDLALPVAAGSLETIRGVANFSVAANDLACAFLPGSLTILTVAQDSLSWNLGQPGTALAVRVPHHEVALAVLCEIGPTVMTGAQLAGEAAIQNVEQAQSALGELVDVYIDGGQLTGEISTVIDATTDQIRLIRKGVLTLAQIRAVMPTVIDASASK